MIPRRESNRLKGLEPAPVDPDQLRAEGLYIKSGASGRRVLRRFANAEFETQSPFMNYEDLAKSGWVVSEIKDEDLTPTKLNGPTRDLFFAKGWGAIPNLNFFVKCEHEDHWVPEGEPPDLTERLEPVSRTFPSTQMSVSNTAS